MTPDKDCEGNQSPEQLLESSARLYDGMEAAVETCPQEMKEQVLVHVMCPVSYTHLTLPTICSV